jgi:chromate reductase
MPEDAQLEIFDLEGIPLFNADIENDPPARVVELKRKIRAADAILMATPEYNHTMSGVMKNAIDWGSRPDRDNSWYGKPAAIMSASTGMLGGARAQMNVRQALVTLNMPTVNQPEVIISSAAGKMDENGELNDEATKKRIRKLIEALVTLAKKK